MKRTVAPLTIIVAGLLLIACEQKPPQTYNEALALSAKSGKPVLVDLSAEWCAPCQVFAHDAKEDADVIKSFENVILFQVDVEKGEGIDLANQFQITGYPTFVLVNSQGQTIDRWIGYTKTYFLETIEQALTDLSTIDQKQARFGDNPNLSDAAALGRYYSSLSEYKQAVDYYTQAQRLRQDEAEDYSYEIFRNTTRGISSELFSYDDAVLAAERVFESSDVGTKIYTAGIMTDLARRNDNKADIKKYLELGIEFSSKSEDPDIKTAHNSLQADYNLLVTGDSAKAVQFKKASMAEGWTEDSGELNSFAWWCYENGVNLEEAETLARKAVELSQPGRAKAMILDTVAHILKARGNLNEAIKFMGMAVTEDPEDEQWKETLNNFKMELEQKN